ncbi:MAG: efflux RND transporter periplasmic adaptor subunit [Myxococcales bacterium]|jgi:membrane fusion protein (multidrug efflux system)|nr:MAG: efflux RND transporter periplasmic adaptor subunit [Myxococcales bacterium]
MTAIPTRARLVSTAIALLMTCATCGGEPPAASTPPVRVYKIDVTPAITRDVTINLRAVGTVFASAQAEIRPTVDGVVSEIAYERGGRVEAGQMLVHLDDRKAAARLQLARATLDSARARLRVAERNLERARSLLEEELVSLEEFDTVEADELAAAAAVREQEAALVLAERELEDYHLSAPFSGIIGARLVDAGNYVSEGTVLVILMKTDPVEIDFRLPDRHQAEVTVGTPIEITETADGNKTVGEITFIDPRVDPGTRMLEVRASARNTAGRLRHGQFVEVSVLAGVREGQIFVPEESVVFTDGATWVYVIENGLAHRRLVELGERLPPSVEVLSGVGADATVVVAGQHRLSDGAAVEVINVVDPPADGA